MLKYCECGCGGLAPICTHTCKKRGCVKGEPLRFIHGHSNKGKNGSMYGKHPSIETRKRMSEAGMGRIISKEAREKISIANKGKCVSAETRKKISEAMKGKKLSKEHKKRIGDANRGKIRSKEMIKKISENNPGMRGKKHSIETRREMSIARKRDNLSPETLKKMSDAQKGEKSWNWKGGKEAIHERNKNDLKFQLNKKMTSRIYKSLKKGSKDNNHWCNLVGYNDEQLKKHLKKTMPVGYTWQDYIEGRLHIDHKIPVSAFNFDTPDHLDFKRCWALTNLQLLSAHENLEKHAKILKTFQPSLKI